MNTLKDDVHRLLKDQESSNVSSALSAIKTLLALIKESTASTSAELFEQLKSAVTIIQEDRTDTLTSTNSGCELFMRFISNITDEGRDKGFEECKKLMLERGDKFVKKVELSRQKIATYGSPHIKEKAVILAHSRSRVVLALLTEASKTKKFKVFVTESLPGKSGTEMAEDLRGCNIEAEVILDAAIGYIMEKIDLVLVGAEGVVASGGIINKIGTFSIAMAAKAFNKPVYVAAESFKFSSLYPLNQQDLPKSHANQSNNQCRDSSAVHPSIDYTPAEYLTLLFTDIGILTPTAVSDELIKLL
ncbi:translation initiation factor eIF2B subunit alpha-like isoform X2 [Watersipora subatra]|uniref:translation initiation factor eIF2B subunit alpha-like isoform X2 n=1 Tax=Watersipora subatra TaxID=2589382 RepID=UPI00355BC49A